MVISKAKEIPICTVNVQGSKVRQVKCLKYLGTNLTSDRRCLTEVKSRIAQAKTAVQRFRPMLCNKATSLKLRRES
jgi:hypothetical protein